MLDAERSSPQATEALTVAPRRGRVIAGEVVSRTIAWPNAQPRETLKLRLDTSSRAAVDASPVPVLVPPDFVETGRIKRGEGWYAFAGQAEGRSVSIQGSAKARLYPGIGVAEPTWTVRGLGGFVTQNEGIWAVSWTEHGAAYSLEVECAKASDDACRDETFALGLAEQLHYVGGKGQRR
jgi:hypothetical protein